MTSAKRQPKQSRKELRSLMLDTGRAILREQGLGTGAEALTFKRVFDRVEQDTGVRLTNASIIRRVWENQAAYQADVLVAVASDGGRIEIDRTFNAIGALFDGFDLSTIETRRHAIREMCRVGGAANIESLRQSSNWTSWIGVWAMATVNDVREQRGRIDAALLSGYRVTTDRFEQIYGANAAALGLRLRNGLTVRQYTMAVGALAEGSALRSRVDSSEMEGILRPTGPNGEEQEWTLFAIGVEALVEQFFELDPDWTPGARAASPTGPKQ
jgi:hypothetical protein